jgi:hypothetical protein
MQIIKGDLCEANDVELCMVSGLTRVREWEKGAQVSLVYFALPPFGGGDGLRGRISAHVHEAFEGAVVSFGLL